MAVIIILKYISALSIIIDAYIAVWVLMKNFYSKLSKAFFIMMMCAVIWELLFWLEYFLPPTIFDTFIDRAIYGMSEVGLLSFVYFLLIFNYQYVKYKKIFFVLLISACFWSVLVFVGVVIGERHYLYNLGTANSFDLASSNLLLYYYISFIPYVLFIFWLLFISLHNYIGIKKIQANYISIGIGGTIFVTTFCNAFLPIFTRYIYKNFLFNWWTGVEGTIIQLLSITLISILSLSIAYAITRYRFMDIRVVIKKTVIHFCVFASLTAMIISLIICINKFLFQEFNIGNVIIIEVVLIVLFLPLIRKTVIRITNKYIHKDEIDLSKNIEEFNREISYSNYLSDLISKSVKFIYRELPIEKVDFIIRDFTKPELSYFFPLADKKKLDEKYQDIFIKYFTNNKEIVLRQEMPFLKVDKESGKNLQKIDHFIQKEHCEVIVALKQNDVFNGFILFGGKKDGDIYSQENTEFIINLNQQINIALAKVLYYEEAVARVKREFGPKN